MDIGVLIKDSLGDMGNLIKYEFSRLVGLWSKNRKQFDIALFLLIGLVFVVKSAVSIDPDFGWRLVTGRYILQNGIPEKDLFSFTMPSFPWVDHAWPVSVSFAVLYDTFGKWFLASVYSAVALTSVVVVAACQKPLSAAKNSTVWQRVKNFAFMDNFIFILAVANIMPFAGIRAQNVTWLMFAILMLLLVDPKLWKRWRFAVPAFFVVWGNVHGGFSAGLVAVAIYIFLKSVRRRKIVWADIVVLLLSSLGTLLNPYGIGTWREAWSSISDTQLRWRIAEWMPILIKFDLSIIAFNTLSFLLIFRFRKDFALEEVGLYLFFLLQGILSARNIPLLAIISVPFACRAINLFYSDIKSDAGAKARFRRVYNVALWGSLALLVLQSTLSLLGAKALSEENYYPVDAVNYVKQSYTGEIRMFSNYGWGGYLTWKLPTAKLFIDGRMPSWRWKANLPNETNDAMQDYLDIMDGDLGFAGEFDKYGVNLVLLPQPPKETLFSIVDKKFKHLLVFFGKENTDFDLHDALEKGGWKKVYEDDKAIVYAASENS